MKLSVKMTQTAVLLWLHQSHSLYRPRMCLLVSPETQKRQHQLTTMTILVHHGGSAGRGGRGGLVMSGLYERRPSEKLSTGLNQLRALWTVGGQWLPVKAGFCFQNPTGGKFQRTRMTPKLKGLRVWLLHTYILWCTSLMPLLVICFSVFSGETA